MLTLPPLPGGELRPWYLSEGQNAYIAAKSPTPLPDIHNRPESCLTCRGRGRFRFYTRCDLGPMHPDQQVAEYACPCRDQAILHRWFLAHGITEQLARFYLGDCHGVEQPIQEFMLDYIERAEDFLAIGRGFLLHGKNGNGKSLVACLVLKHLASLGRSVYWTTFAEMLNLLTKGFQREEDQHWFETMVRGADVLVLDDMGQEHDKRTIARSGFDGLLRQRVQSARATIVTTNMELAEVGPRFSDAIHSSLREACKAERMTGKDWRYVPDAESPLDRLIDYEIKNKITRPFTFGVF